MLKKLGDILQLDKHNKIDIRDDDKYYIAGVQSYGKGVVIRRSVVGKELTMKQYQVIKKDQLMWCKVDTKNGAFGLTKEEHVGSLASTNMALANIDTKKIIPKFLETLFQVSSFHKYITKYSSGSTNRKYLTPQQLFELIEIPNFSIEEQKKFIERVESIKKSGLEQEIKIQLNLLSRLRQAILQEAIEGKLTAQWRKENPDEEPASKLLKKIRDEIDYLIETKKIKKEKVIPAISKNEILYEIPNSWEWIRLGHITNIVRGGSPRPAGDKRYYDGDIPFLKVADLTKDDNIFVSSHTYTIKEAGLHKTRFIEGETLMLTNSGATLGVPKICNFPTTFNDGIAAFIYMNECLDKRFFYYLLKSKTNWFLTEAARGQGQPNLNTDIIGNTLIALPPAEEQKRIVKEIEIAMTICDEIEQQINESKVNTDMLMQAVLKEAFEHDDK